MILDKEHKLLNNLIFSDITPSKEEITKISYEKFIKISSSNLVLPLTYLKIIEKNCQKSFPKKMIEYMREIYRINKNRNTQLIIEANEIARVLKKEKIEYVFIKGTAMIFANLYRDIGERMIGDIDFLIRNNNLEKVDNIFTKYSYKSKKEYVYSRSRHLKKRVKKGRLFSIEPHFKLLSTNNNYICNDEFMDRSNIIKNIYLPDSKDMLLNNIYNHQINDNGYIKMFLNYRNVYDTFLLSKKYELGRINLNPVLEDYFRHIIKNKIFDVNIQLKSSLKFNLRYKFKYSNIITYNIDKLVSNSIINMTKFFYKCIEIFNNKNYRKKIIYKLLKKQ